MRAIENDFQTALTRDEQAGPGCPWFGGIAIGVVVGLILAFVTRGLLIEGLGGVSRENFGDHVRQFDALSQRVDGMRDAVFQHEGTLRILSGQINRTERMLVPEEPGQRRLSTEGAVRSLEAPFDVSKHFVPSGFMGDWANIDLDVNYGDA